MNRSLIISSVLHGALILITAMIFLNRDLQSILTLLALFAAAAFRILPSLTRIMTSIQNIIFFKPAIDTVYKEFGVKSNIKNERYKSVLV